MHRRSNSPPFDRRRSPRRDRRDFPPRRRRSFSRDRYDGNRRRPSPKRFRREDDYDRYDRSPYRRGYDRDRDYDPYHNRRDGPMSYREFIAGLPDDVTPEEAHKRYQDHVADCYGSALRAEFEQNKDKDWMKAKYDPRTITNIIEQHKKHAEEACKRFEEACKEGGELDIRSADFNQGVTRPPPDKKEEGSDDNVFEAPRVCWSRDRVANDLKLSMDLIQKLDEEKGIKTPAVFILQDAQQSSQKEKSQEEEKKESQEAKDDDVKRLDLLLTYLWRVHMIDYYSGIQTLYNKHHGRVFSGHELDDKEYESVKCRMLRPKKDQALDEETDKRMLEKLKVRVDAFWKDRVQKGDPLKHKLQTEHVEKAVEEFVESQVTQLDEERGCQRPASLVPGWTDGPWGNKLSSKMFVGKEFVIKHIRLKHSAVVDAEREKILDNVYFDNFRKGREEEQRKRAEEQERALQFGQGSDGHVYGEFGYGPGMGGQGMMQPMMPQMMGAPMGQILMPAPGAGPMGPFVLQPVPTGGMAPMDMSQNRNMEAIQGSRMGSGGMRQQREYHDLDAPQNNRAVLDYGDL